MGEQDIDTWRPFGLEGFAPKLFNNMVNLLHWILTVVYGVTLLQYLTIGSPECHHNLDIIKCRGRSRKKVGGFTG